MDERSPSEKKSGPPTLSDEQIVTNRQNRRSFLTTVGLGGAALAAAVLTNACGKNDSCDTDDGTDSDPTDPVGRGRLDPCDTDGN